MIISWLLVLLLYFTRATCNYCPTRKTITLNPYGRPISCHSSSDCPMSSKCFLISGYCCEDLTVMAPECPQEMIPVKISQNKLLQCKMTDKTTCPNGSVCVPSSIPTVGHCCAPDPSEGCAVGSRVLRKDTSKEAILCSPSTQRKADTCPGESSCQWNFNLKQYQCCEPDDGCPRSHRPMLDEHSVVRACDPSKNINCPRGGVCWYNFWHGKFQCCQPIAENLCPANMVVFLSPDGPISCNSDSECPEMYKCQQNICCGHPGACPRPAHSPARDEHGRLRPCFAPGFVDCPGDSSCEPSIYPMVVRHAWKQQLCCAKTVLTCADGGSPYPSNKDPMPCDKSKIDSCPVDTKCRASNVPKTFICCRTKILSAQLCPKGWILENNQLKILSSPHVPEVVYPRKPSSSNLWAHAAAQNGVSKGKSSNIQAKNSGNTSFGMPVGPFYKARRKTYAQKQYNNTKEARIVLAPLEGEKIYTLEKYVVVSSEKPEKKEFVKPRKGPMSGVFVCCRLASNLQCSTPNITPYIINNAPRLCTLSNTIPNPCPLNFSCQPSNVAQVHICCPINSNIRPLPAIQINRPVQSSYYGNQIMCMDGSIPAYVGQEMVQCNYLNTPDCCPPTYICALSTQRGINVCCHSQLRSSARLSSRKEVRNICPEDSILVPDGDNQCFDSRECPGTSTCHPEPNEIRGHCCQQLECNEDYSLRLPTQRCVEDGECGENGKCQGVPGLEDVRVCCIPNFEKKHRCLGRGTFLHSGHSIFCTANEDCPAEHECSNSTTTGSSICCASSKTHDLCPENRIPYRNVKDDQPIKCAVTELSSACPTGYVCKTGPSGDSFCCSFIAFCPPGKVPDIDERLNHARRCRNSSDCAPGYSCGPSSVELIQICCSSKTAFGIRQQSQTDDYKLWTIMEG
uniref:EB domain-containing protein n=1 Tax=Bursaphelenchus xylophilus TaxID=6326 RepID=A0A1I7SVT0_BURXY